MSVINKSPFLANILSGLSSAQVEALFDCINGKGGEPIFRSLKPQSSNLLTSSDKGISPIVLELNQSRDICLNGYLIYTDSDCVLVSYANDDAQLLDIIKITMPRSGVDIKWERINEVISITDLRSELFDLGNGGGSGGGTSVVANPELAGTEPYLAGLQVGESKYKIPSATVANPQLAGTESDLESLQIGNTKYKIPSTFRAFAASWPTTGTTAAFCAAIDADTNAKIGMAYLGGVEFSDLPFVGNGDIVVEILEGPNNGKSIHLILTSGDVAPYHWEYTYWNSGSNVSGWIANLVAQDIAAPLYNNQATYAEGDLVTYGNKLYQCNTAIGTPEAFDSTKWTETTLAAAVLGMINTGV